MEIRIDEPVHEVKLCILDAGDVFEYLNNYYITTDDYNYEVGEWRCVNLRSGALRTFCMDAKVIKLDTVLSMKKEGAET